MKILRIKWQRLVDTSGDTCPRCRETGQAVDSAVEKLERALAPLGIQVEAQMTEISPETFAENPIESNKIRINGRLLEEWLGGTTGTSPCCDACGDAECRTTTIAGATYEAIPEHLIVQAGLMAAAPLGSNLYS